MAIEAKNKVTFGLCNGKYAVATPNSDGYTFGTVKALPNLQSFSLTRKGGKSDVAADDTIIASIASFSGADITIKLSELSEEFKKDVLGYKEDSAKGLCEVTNAAPVTFAFGFEVKGDVKKRRIWYYLCTATQGSEATETNSDSITPNSDEVVITARPINCKGTYVLRRIVEEGASDYDTSFTTVTAPTFV